MTLKDSQTDTAKKNMKDAVRKYYMNNQVNGKVQLDFDTFYSWVNYGFSVGVNKHCIEGKNTKELNK
jgi:hypothetical protein